MVINPYSRIRELEAMLERSELERIRVCDELRHCQSQLDVAVTSERQARLDFKEHAERVQDWQATLLRQPGIHNRTMVNPAPMPKAVSSSRQQGVEMERQQVEAVEKQFLANCN